MKALRNQNWQLNVHTVKMESVVTPHLGVKLSSTPLQLGVYTASYSPCSENITLCIEE